jgi:hypothetical protein
MEEGMLPSLRERFPNGLPIHASDFHDQIRAETFKLWQLWVPYHGDLEAPLHRSTHLALGFAEDEFKFLPLWAGGLDDGTGAVFDDMTVPDTDMGPNQPGPAYVTGKTIAPSSTANSDMTIIGGGMSVQAVQSGVGTGESGSLSKTTDSFVEVSASETSTDLGDFDMVRYEVKSLEGALGNIGIFSDTSKSDEDFSDATDNRDDAQSMAGESGDVINDGDHMSLDSEWSNIYD